MKRYGKRATTSTTEGVTMARRTKVELLDDLDGSEAQETIAFSFDGKSWEIDLNAEHAEEFRAAMGPWTTAARRAVSGRRSTSRPRSPRSGDQTAVVRQWARDNGYEVSERGRISREVQDAYDAAH